MIISRYLLKEVTQALLVVTLLLMLILLSQQFVRYLNYVASGKIAINILLQMIGFEIPYLLALLLPLGLYLGIMLAYGRLNANSELPVMRACGYGSRRLFRVTNIFALFIVLLIFVLMIWVNPQVATRREQVVNLSANMNAIQTILPGRFQVSNDGRRVIYVERLSRDRRHAENIFLAQEQVKSGEDKSGNENPWMIVSAKEGYQSNELGQRFLVANQGYRYEGVPGQNDYRIIQFKKYAVRLPTDSMAPPHQEDEAIPSLKLWQDYTKPAAAAELQWRLSIPLSALLLAWLAIPLSNSRPRQGRYIILLLSLLIYIVYVNLLFVARHWVEQATLPINIGMWSIHAGLFILILLTLFLSSRQWSLK